MSLAGPLAGRLFARMDIHTAAFGLDGELFASTIDAAYDLVTVRTGTAIRYDRDG